MSYLNTHSKGETRIETSPQSYPFLVKLVLGNFYPFTVKPILGNIDIRCDYGLAKMGGGAHDIDRSVGKWSN
jgi:hypothetical protein